MKCKHGEFDPMKGCPECIAERETEVSMPRLPIVKVRYGADATEGREYSYYSEEALQVGDLVSVPTKNGTVKARVTAIDIPEAEIEAFKSAVRTIPAGSLVDVETPADVPAPSPEDLSEAGSPTFQAAMRDPNPGAPEETGPHTTDELTEQEIKDIADRLPAPGGNQTAMIRVGPEKDDKVQALYEEGCNLLSFAQSRVIATNDDLKGATDDLAIIAKVRKAVEEMRKEYTAPIRGHLDEVNNAFKRFTEPLKMADDINRKKVTDYRAEVERQRLKAEETNRMAQEVARRQAEESGTGEFKVDTTEVTAPPPAPARVHTGMGTVGTAKVHKWEVEDLKLVPDDYKMVDAAKVGAVVKASKGTITIPGIRVWTEDAVRVTTR